MVIFESSRNMVADMFYEYDQRPGKIIQLETVNNIFSSTEIREKTYYGEWWAIYGKFLPKCPFQQGN